MGWRGVRGEGESRRLSWRRAMQAGRDGVGRVEERLGGRGRVDNRRVEVVSWWEWLVVVGPYKWHLQVEDVGEGECCVRTGGWMVAAGWWLCEAEKRG